MKLNQLLAVEKGVKADSLRVITDIYHIIQKVAPLGGLLRTYQPNNEDGDRLPTESTKVQVEVDGLLNNAIQALAQEWDITASKDRSNQFAVADIVVEGKTLLTSCPATFLLYLEKSLVNLTTLIEKLPVLDADNIWHRDTSNSHIFATEPVLTSKSKKVPKVFVKYEATKEHPAQTEMYYEDISVGVWTQVKFSGAIPADRRTLYLARVRALLAAVKSAREQANMQEVKDFKAGLPLLNYVFGPDDNTASK